MITQTELKELLFYDPQTGDFTWLVRTCNRIKVGDVAGWLDDGYVRIKVCGIKYRANRLAWLYMTSEWPKVEIDHYDTIRSNNRWENLREATHSLNAQNQRKAHRDNKTGFLGVKPNGKGFEANIMLDDEAHYLGIHSTPQLAHDAYLKAKRELHPGCTI